MEIQPELTPAFTNFLAQMISNILRIHTHRRPWCQPSSRPPMCNSVHILVSSATGSTQTPITTVCRQIQNDARRTVKPGTARTVSSLLWKPVSQRINGAFFGRREATTEPTAHRATSSEDDEQKAKGSTADTYTDGTSMVWVVKRGETSGQLAGTTRLE